MVAAGLLIASIAAPADLPGPLDALAPTPPAEAASGTVIAGTPDPCSAVDPDPDDSSTDWIVVSGANPDDRECVLTTDAVCPANHMKPAAGNPPPYLCYPSRCSDAFDVDRLADYWVPLPSVDTSRTNMCHVFELTVCSAGIGPTHEGMCLYVQRRSWTCPNEYDQHNRFNTCYQPHTEVTGTPCDTSTGAPDLPLLSCENYVGDDYEDTKDCDDISSRLTDRAGGAAADYWCEFDASRLSIACHRSPVPSSANCAHSTGVCLKRASTPRGQQLRALGGCRAIARNIECAIHQANYADNVDTATDLEALARTIRAAGCEPCRVMPFEPLDLGECPDSVLNNTPTTVDLDNQEQRLRFRVSCSQKLALQNKSSIRPIHHAPWKLEEPCGLRPAFQNKSITPYCQELPPSRLTWSTPSFTGMAMVNARVRLDLAWDEASITRAPGRATDKGLNICFLHPNRRPYFVVEVEPLWPAGDRDLLEELFGSDSLGWWDALSAEQQAERTAAFYTNTDTDPVQVACNIGVPVWCIWEPQQAGYYSLTAIGALSFTIQIGIQPHPDYTGSISADWLPQLSDNALNECSRDTTPPQCQFRRSGSGSEGSYIDGEPIGIQVREVRVVSRTPSS